MLLVCWCNCFQAVLYRNRNVHLITLTGDIMILIELIALIKPQIGSTHQLIDVLIEIIQYQNIFRCYGFVIFIR